MMSSEENFSTGQDPTRPARKSGRAVFGADGRGVWEWQTSPGVFTRDITDEQLSALEAPHLELADPDAITLRRSQRQLQRASVHAATQSAAPGTAGRWRRLLRRVARILS